MKKAVVFVALLGLAGAMSLGAAAQGDNEGAYEVKKAGEGNPGVRSSTDVTRAAPGEKPSGAVTDTVTVRFTITGIDKAASEASLRDPNGKVTVVKVKDPAKLDLVQVGDIVDVTYTEALAVAVEKD